MSNILFAVHRAAPYPGGSEYYVQNMAEEMKIRGHDVTILANEFQYPEYRGIKITNDYECLFAKWDLIIVHGGDVITQNIIHVNSFQIDSPILYMIIKPSESDICMKGMAGARFLGYSTTADIEHIKKHGYMSKARRIRHGIDVAKDVSEKGHFKSSQIQTEKMFVSAGGYYANKQMVPLAKVFEEANIPNTTLAIFGYGPGDIPPETAKVKAYINTPKHVVSKAIADADLYIMHSTDEGFGLVLLEAMASKTPWAARNIAGAKDMREYGFVYENDDELKLHMKMAVTGALQNQFNMEYSYDYVMTNHLIKHTVNDIEDVLKEIK